METPSPAMTLGTLAFYVAIIPGRYMTFAEEGKTSIETLTTHHSPKHKKEIIDGFSNGTATAMKLLKDGDNRETRTWSLTKDGSPVFTLPIPLFIRLLVFNHLIHHRGQLSAYLRT